MTAFAHDVNAPGLAVSNALVAHFFDPDPNANANQFTATVDWGDGSAPSAGTITPFEPPAEYYVSGSHTYRSIGTYPITVTIMDVGGARAVAGADALAGRDRRLAVVGPSDHSVWVRGNPDDGGWVNLDGVVAGGVAIAALRDRFPMFPLYIAVGTDAALWARTDFQGWYHLSSAYTNCLDTPAALVDQSNRLVVACEGSDHGLWLSSTALVPGTLPVMGAFGPLGGKLTDGPAMIPDGRGGVEILANEADGVHIWTAAAGFTGTTWHCIGRPAAAYGAIAYFGCRGTDDALWYALSSDLRSWSSAGSAGGTLTGPPGIAAFLANDALVSVEGTDGGVWEVTLRFDGSATPYHSLGGSIVNGAGAVAVSG